MQFFAGVLVGQRGGVVCVKVDENDRVGILRRAFIDEVNRDDKDKRIQCAADNVELFLAQIDGVWLPSRDDRVQQLTKGEIPEDIQDILCGYPLDATSSVHEICNGSTPEKTIQILIVAPPRSVENASNGNRQEPEVASPRRKARSVIRPHSTSKISVASQPVQAVSKADSSAESSTESLPLEPVKEDSKELMEEDSGVEPMEEESGIERMDEDTKEYLREFAAILPRSSGKWIKVLEEYKTRNPKTRLTPENLRGRLKLRSKDVRAARPERSATESLTSKPMEDDSGVEPMDDETREYLREIAAALPRTSGKWTKVLQEYKKRNPKTKLTPENLRGRLKWKKPRVRRDVPNQPVVTKEGRKRQRLIAACSSCQKAKVKCGADSKNRDCEYRDIAHNQSKET